MDRGRRGNIGQRVFSTTMTEVKKWRRSEVNVRVSRKLCGD